MKIIQPDAQLMDPKTKDEGIKLLQKIEYCGRISHRSEEAQTDDSYRRFIEAVVLGHGDWSIVEHASATVLFTVDRGITHEIVRHRLAAYTQESTRFVNYEKKIEPSCVQPMGLTYGGTEIWKDAVDRSEEAYLRLLGTGCPPQIARSVFPNSLAAKLVMTCNLRNWRHFFLMRTSKESHPQMREVTIPLLAQFKERIPILYDDIMPEARQIDNMRKPR